MAQSAAPKPGKYRGSSPKGMPRSGAPAAHRSGQWIKGAGLEMKKVAQYEDILGQELANKHKYLYLPERFVFNAIQVGEAADEAEADLEKQKD